MREFSQPWPTVLDYQNAVLHHRRFLKDPRLHPLKVQARYFMGAHRPEVRSGNFGAVYRFHGQNHSLALKVFYRADVRRALRYRLIHEHLARLPPAPSLVSFQYDEKGIMVAGRSYPTLIMDWVNGRPLDLYLHRRGGRVKNGLLCLAWARAVHSLRQRRIAHGDLQHGNILIQPDGRLRLVDYDGMFVPAMCTRGLPSSERGSVAYQHPLRVRHPEYFDERLDDFSSLVILLSLAAIEPGLWQQYHRDDNQLIFAGLDWKAPGKSVLLSQLLQAPDAPVRKLARILLAASQGSLDDIPPFENILADATIQQVLTPLWRPSLRRAVSVLQPWWSRQAAHPAKSRRPSAFRRIGTWRR